jgi:hypothetical protein
LFYIMLYAINQDKSRQMAWIISYVIWLLLEVVVVSTVVMLMSQFAVPSIMLSEVKAAKAKMIDSVQGYQSKIVNNSVREGVAAADFNSTQYLFTSTRLAAQFPGSLESDIILDFSTNLPKRTYKRVKNKATDAYRTRLRLTAVSLTLLSLERCFYDLVCWAGIGFAILWQIVLFQSYSLLVGIMVCTFLVALGIYSHTLYSSAVNAPKASKPGVIAVRKTFGAEETKGGDDDYDDMAAQLIMHDVVARLGKQRRTNFSPRYSRAMDALRKASSFRTEEVRDGRRGSASAVRQQIELVDDYQDSEGDGFMGDVKPIQVPRISERETDHVSRDRIGLSDSDSISDSENGSDTYSSTDSDLEGVIMNDIRDASLTTKETSVTASVLPSVPRMKRTSLATRIRRNRESIQRMGMQNKGKEESCVLDFDKIRTTSYLSNRSSTQDSVLQKHVAQRSSSKQSDRGEQTDRAKVKKVVPIRRQRSTEESEHLKNLSNRRKDSSSRTIQ